MCLIERKTYKHSDREETVETTKLCNRAVGSNPCSRLEYKNLGSINIVEAKPPKPSSPPKRRIVTTEGFNGRRRSGLDVSARSSNSSFRQSTIMTDQSPDMSPASPPSSAPSPSVVEIKPKAPTPPTTGPLPPPLERVRSPYSGTSSPIEPLMSPASPPDPKRRVKPDGTAVYERPPSLDFARASNNERPRPSALAREPSASSMKAQVDDTDRPSSSRRGKQPAKIDTSRRPTASDSPSLESPGLSSLPGIESLRLDSDKEDNRHDSKLPGRDRGRGERLRWADEERYRQDEEDHRQASLEQDRLAGSARRRQPTQRTYDEDDSRDRRRQPTRQAYNEDESRERHRRDAADRLEGQRTDPIDDELAFEQAQMSRERERAAARRRDSQLSQQYIDEQPRWDSEERYYDDRTSPLARRRSYRITSDAQPASPSSTRSSTRGGVTLHHQPSTTRRNSAIAERGEDVLARERERARARDASRNLNAALGEEGTRTDEERYEYEDAEYERGGKSYVVGEGQESKDRRRRQRRRERHG